MLWCLCVVNSLINNSGPDGSNMSWRESVDIREINKNHRGIIPYLFSAHALTDCAYYCSLLWLQQGKVIKDVQSGPKLTSTDTLQSDIEELIKKATAFIAACYCVKQMPEEMMNDIWFQVRLSKTGKKKNHVYSRN